MSIENTKDLIQNFLKSDQQRLVLDNFYSKKDRQEIHQYIENVKLYSQSKTCPGTNLRIIQIQKYPFETKDEISSDLIEIFLRYSGYSMPNTKYFQDYLKTLDLYTNASKDWEMFLEDFRITFKNDLASLKKETLRVTQEIKAFLEKSEEFQKFKKIEPVLKNGKLDSLYNQTRSNQFFLSIDIRKANWTMLKKETGDLLKELEWKDFLGHFTKSKFLLESKYFREHIFGNCRLTDKTVVLAYNHLKGVQEQLLDPIPELKDLTIVYQKGDEIVYQLPNQPLESQKIAQKVQEKLKEDHSELKVTYFRLEQLGKYDYYIKVFFDIESRQISQYEFKKVPNTFLMPAIKYWFRKPVQKSDLKFIYQGLMASFDQSIFEV